jgi:hypothetical protein
LGYGFHSINNLPNFYQEYVAPFNSNSHNKTLCESEAIQTSQPKSVLGQDKFMRTSLAASGSTEKLNSALGVTLPFFFLSRPLGYGFHSINNLPNSYQEYVAPFNSNSHNKTLCESGVMWITRFVTYLSIAFHIYKSVAQWSAKKKKSIKRP